jgi:hypothetical protein
MAKRAVKAPALVYPTCARHGKPRKDVRIRNYYLCDTCADQWMQEAFDACCAAYVGPKVHGYCLLCNRESKDIRVRSWFLCDICDRVAGSIGRNHIAEQSILDYWAKDVQPKIPHLKIAQIDRSSLRPRRQTDESATAPIDFLIEDTRKGKNVFGIENKTGRSSVRDMSQFQLDISDCDTIINDMKRLKIPAYIIHAQVLELWKPPTVGFRIVSLWWTDVFKMAEHFKSIKQRRDENRGAAYFGKKAFSPIETFADEIESNGKLTIVEEFKRAGIPTMYHA